MIITYQKYIKAELEESIRCAESRYGFPLRSEEIALIDREADILYKKPQQIARVQHDEMVGLDCVQSYVSNMTTATTLLELSETDGVTLPEILIHDSCVDWTAPKWAKAGDVVFFMHSKTARSTITRLRTELNKSKAELDPSYYYRLMDYIEHALEIHSQYGGKIFAIGRICGAPEYIEPENFIDNVSHCRSRVYASVDNIVELEHPIDISDFHDYINISRGGSVTPLFDEEFDRLRKDICHKNPVPEYVKNAIARPVPLRLINDRNWFEVANDYRRSFILEKQFRQFYVDYLLRAIGDQKRFFTECRCQRKGMSDSFMDYVIRFDGKYLPVETKLSVKAEPDIVAQVGKYVHNSRVYLTIDNGRYVSGNGFHDGKVLIIDTEKVYMYDDASRKESEIFDLDGITTHGALEKLRSIIKEHL